MPLGAGGGGAGFGLALQERVAENAALESLVHLPCPGLLDHVMWELRACWELNWRLQRWHGRCATGSGGRTSATSFLGALGWEVVVRASALASQAGWPARGALGDGGLCPIGVRERGRGRKGVPCGMHNGMVGTLALMGWSGGGVGGTLGAAVAPRVPRRGAGADSEPFAGARKGGNAENTGGFGVDGGNLADMPGGRMGGPLG